MATNDPFAPVRPCKPCRDAVSIEAHVVIVHATIHSFLKSVNENCHFCCSLFHQLALHQQKELASHCQSRNIYKIRRPAESLFSTDEDLLVRYHHSSEPCADAPVPVVSFRRGYAQPPRAFGSLWGSFKFNLFVLTPLEWHVHCGIWNEHVLRAGGKSPLKAMLAANPVLQLWPLSEEMARSEDTGIPGAVTSLSTDSDETFSKIRRWLNKCEGHETCRVRRQGLDPSWLPTRLVKIEALGDDSILDGSSSSGSGMKCRIVETKTDRPLGDLTYITLSHRWPVDSNLVATLSADNLEAWKVNLPLGSLSRTFRDTFRAALELNISYVWIDSLCIIQEGASAKADWEVEARMMHEVYSHARLNIYAARGDTDGGLFTNRNPEDLILRRAHLDPALPPTSGSMANSDKGGGVRNGSTKFSVTAPYDDKNGALRPFKHVYSKHVLATEQSKPGELWKARMNISPLATRGWVFQEQLLSLANLHFGRDEVLFECREMRASESLGTEEDYGLKVYSWGGNGYKKTLPLDGSDAVRAFGQGGAYSCWYTLLNEYSARQLTKLEDRLVAMSGVAQHFKSKVLGGDVYIAGLWYSRLATDLLWRHAKGSAPRDVWQGLFSHWVKPYRCFSFSWISVSSPIEQPILFPVWFGYIAKVECVRYRTGTDLGDIQVASTEEPFIEDIFSLSPAPPRIELKVTGYLRQMSLVASPSSLSGASLAHIDCLIGEENMRLILGQHASMPQECMCIKGETRLDFSISLQDLSALNEAGLVFGIPLTSRDSVKRRTWLLLMVLVDPAMGRFRRIGVHEGGIWPERQEEELAAWLFANDPPPCRDDQWTHPRDFPCWSYNEAEGQHTIFVI